MDWAKRSVGAGHSHFLDTICAQAAHDVSGGAGQQQPQDLTSPQQQQDNSAAHDAGGVDSQQQLQQEVLAQGAQVRLLDMQQALRLLHRDSFPLYSSGSAEGSHE